MARFFVLLLACACLGACGAEKPKIDVPADAIIQLSDVFTGEFDLVDKNGRRVSDEDFEGKLALVYFGYTSCPDVCPGDIGVMSAALNELGDNADEIAMVFISVDPERDTPKALADYFGFDDRLIPLTGATEAAAAARTAFKQVAIKKPGSGPLGYTVDHLRLYYILDRKGNPTIAIKGGVSPTILAEILQRQLSK